MTSSAEPSRSIADRLIRAICARVPLAEKLLGAGDGKLALSAAIVFAIRIGGAALAYAMAFVLVRLLGAKPFGIYIHVSAAANLVALVLPLGLNGAVLRFIPEYRIRRSHSHLLGVMGLSRWVVSLASTAVALALAAALLSFPDMVPEPYFAPALLAIASLPLLSVLDLYESFARGFGWTGLAYVPPYIALPLGILVCLAPVLLLGGTATAASAMAAFLAATLASLIGLAVVFHRRLRLEMPTVLPLWRSRVWMTAALPLLVVETARAAIEQMDLLTLGVLAGPEEVAAYFAAARTAGLLGFISFAAAALAVTRYSELYAAGQMDRLQAAVRTTIHMAFWPTLAGLLVLTLLGPLVLSFFDPEFSRSYPALLLLAFGFLIRASAGPVEYLLNAAGDQRATAGIYILGGLANLAANVVLIPLHGLTGAALATMLSVALVTALLVHRAWARLGILSLPLPVTWMASRGASCRPTMQAST